MRRLILFIFSILIIAGLLLASCGPATPARIRVAVDASALPFEYINIQTNQIEGFGIDLFNAIAEKAGLEADYVNMNFEALLEGVAACEYDAAISSITITEERSQLMLFSDPYFSAGQVIVVHKDNDDIRGKENLSGKRVGYKTGTTGAVESEKMVGVFPRNYDDISAAYQDLIRGEIDAVIYDNSLAQYYINRNPDTLKAVGTLITEENYGIAVCRENTQLLKKINDGLKAVRDDGTVDRLIKKWIGG